MRVSTEWTRTYEITADVSPVIPSVTDRDPDSCHDVEGGEIENVEISVNGVPVPESAFTKKELGEIYDAIGEEAAREDNSEVGRRKPDDDYEEEDIAL